MPVVALGAWALAQAVLFKLYLPHRYTYPLVAFFAIVVAVTLEPTWKALAASAAAAHVRAAGLRRSRSAAFAVYVFPLAPVAPARRRSRRAPDRRGRRAWRRRAAVALAGGGRPAPGAAVHRRALLVAARSCCPDRLPRGNACPRPARDHLPDDSLPKDAVVAGDPSGPPVRARDGAAARRDLDPARAVLRGRLLPRGPRAHVRDAAGLLRVVAATPSST